MRSSDCPFRQMAAHTGVPVWPRYVESAINNTGCRANE